MKCAYCKEEVDRDVNTYRVEINGIECEVALHYDCLKKVIGGYFSKPPLVYNVTQEKADEVIREWSNKPWPPQWDAGGTLEVEKPSNTRVWCKTDDEGYKSWRDRVD